MGLNEQIRIYQIGNVCSIEKEIAFVFIRFYFIFPGL